MRMTVPQGRANYQPNSWQEGPRETPELGHGSFPEETGGPKRRLRAESFSDHYSQARQFYISQTPIEQGHIAAALTFELSKVESPRIRARVVSHLLNIDKALAAKVAKKLGLDKLPRRADAAQKTRVDLEESPALSIIRNGPDSFAGRKVGAMVTDGVSAKLVRALKDALAKDGAMLEIVAPRAGGVTTDKSSRLEAQQMLDGGPSVLFDAVVLLVSEDGAADLLDKPAARDFVADAYAHCKFIGYSAPARALFRKAGIDRRLDKGFFALDSASDVIGFVTACRKLRFWEREAE